MKQFESILRVIFFISALLISLSIERSLGLPIITLSLFLASSRSFTLWMTGFIILILTIGLGTVYLLSYSLVFLILSASWIFLQVKKLKFSANLWILGLSVISSFFVAGLSQVPWTISLSIASLVQVLVSGIILKTFFKHHQHQRNL